MTFRRPSLATILAGTALFVALGGPADAARTLGLKDNSVTSKKIRNRTISTADLSAVTIRKLMLTPAGSVRGATVADGSLSGADLAPGSVGGDRLAPGSIGGDRLAPGSVAGDRLAANAVGSGQIVDNSVGGADIAASAISSDEVADGSLSANDLGRYTGRLSDLDFGTIARNACKSVASTSLTPVASGNQDLRDDALVLTPTGSFPAAGLTLLAHAISANQVQVTICNVGGPDPLNLGSRSFSYVSFDTVG